MNETKEKIVPPPKAPAGPAGLDGVFIDGCAFTESVSKREPRPPLFWNQNTSNVFLFLDEDRFVYVRISNPIWDGAIVRVYGQVYSESRDFRPGSNQHDRTYTGPITPAMWAIIRKWWTP